jgi:hypothetical protein
MRRTGSQPHASGIDRVAALMREGSGLRLLQAALPAGATLADARRARERILQLGRQPCSFLDRALDIDRG